MKVYIVQKQHQGISNVHFFNVKTFSSFQKAFKYIAELKLVPLNFLDSTQFLHEPIKEFGTVDYFGINDEKREVTNRHQIVTVEVE